MKGKLINTENCSLYFKLIKLKSKPNKALANSKTKLVHEQIGKINKLFFQVATNFQKDQASDRTAKQNLFNSIMTKTPNVDTESDMRRASNATNKKKKDKKLINQ